MRANAVAEAEAGRYSWITSVTVFDAVVQERLQDALDWNFDTASFAELEQVRGRPIAVMAKHLVDHCNVLTHIPDWMIQPDLSPVPAAALRDRVLAFMTELDNKYL